VQKPRPAPRKPALRALMAENFSPRVLMLDSPVEGHADTDEYSDFAVPHASTILPLEITVSAQDGDPDLYVGCGSSLVDQSDYPSQGGTVHWRSNNGYGDDAVTITSDDWSACSGDSDVLISVYGYRNSTFTIIAHSESGGGPIPLYDDITQYGYVAEDEYDYYSFDGESKGIEVSVESLDGDADLYIGCAGEQVTISNYRWSSALAGDSDDAVEVEDSDPEYCSNGFKIAVYGYLGSDYDDDFSYSYGDDDAYFNDFSLDDDYSWDSPNARPTRRLDSSHVTYDITASTTGSIEPLDEDATWVDMVEEDEYAYFSIGVEDFSSIGIKISVAPQDQDTDVDLVVGCSNDAKPTTGDNRWKSDQSFWSPDTVIIDPTDPDFCPDEGEFIIGVYGYTTPSDGGEFSIVISATLKDQGYIEMPFGIRVGGQLSYKTGGDDVRPEFYLLHIADADAISWFFLAGEGKGVSLAMRAIHNETDLDTLPDIRNAHWRKQIDGWDGSGTPTPGEIDIEMDDPILEGAWAITASILPNDDTEESIYLVYADNGDDATELSEVEFSPRSGPKPASPRALRAAAANKAKKAAMEANEQ